jgi:gamma-glutamyltranspeptidase / glutathione hydrolase
MVPTRPTAMGRNGVVATPHYLASVAGLYVLQDGGDAIDACVAASAVLGPRSLESCARSSAALAVICSP